MAESQSGKTEIKTAQVAIRVIDFSSYREQNLFRLHIEGLIPDKTKLNLVFPLVLNYESLHEYPLELRDGLTSLPEELLDSNTYDSHPELRGQMEEIILVTNKQRQKNNYPLLAVQGNSWSEHFGKRLHDIEVIVPNEVSVIQASDVSNEPASKVRRLVPTKSRLNINSARPYNVTDDHGVQKRHRNKQGFTVVNGKVMPKRYRRD